LEQEIHEPAHAHHFFRAPKNRRVGEIRPGHIPEVMRQVVRSKSDRAKDAQGGDKPPVHRKGEEKGGFTVKKTNYKDSNNGFTR